MNRSYPNLTITTYSYDSSDNLTGMQTIKGETDLDSVTYTHDYVGNRFTRTDPLESWRYDYDQIYRLTGATPTGNIHTPEAYTYDADQL